MHESTRLPSHFIVTQDLLTNTLADVVNLSPSHFCRGFKRSVGITVHRYVMQRRVEKAQQLMLTTAEALSGIALSCGMSDQSHLTRWFRRVVGETPAAWRRARYEPSNLTSEAT
jgi:AraC family transcriptional regulator